MLRPAALPQADHPVWAWLRHELPAPPQLQRLGGRQSHTWLVRSDRREVVVKLAPGAELEAQRLGWLAERLPVAQVLAVIDGTPPALVTSRLPGMTLAERRWRARPQDVTALLAAALRLVHAVSLQEWPGGASDEHVFIHGDACLPNVLAARGRITGVVDVAACGPGDCRDDIAAALWSLEYNLGTDPARDEQFCRLLGKRIDPDERDALRRRYVDGA